MDEGWYLQVAGAGLELTGLILVAWGISETRARFGRPSLVEKAGTAITRAAARLRRRPRNVTLEISSALHAHTCGHVYGTVTQGPFAEDMEVDERIDRLRLMVNSHADSLTRLDQKVDEERTDRGKASNAPTSSSRRK